MELEKVTAEIRPRSEWEAVDLGLSLTRRHVKGLCKAWMTLVFPVCLLIVLACWQRFGWAVFVMWWLKPLFERVVLYDLSRELFGESPTMKGRVKSFWQQLRFCWFLILVGFFLAVVGVYGHALGADFEMNEGAVALFWLSLIGLLFYRSSLTRSLTLPVNLLEGLKGSAYRKRVRVLSRRSSGAAAAFTMLTMIMEVALCWSLIHFVYLMIPVDFEWDVYSPVDWGRLIVEMLTNDLDYFRQGELAMVAVFYFIAMSVTTWFYVGGGFGLYVNSRTWSEGWDIELSFKKIGQRLSVILVCFFVSFDSVEASSRQERVEEILAHEDFEIHRETTKYWVSERQEEVEEREAKEVDVTSFASIGEMIFWITVVLIGVGLIWLIVKNLHVFQMEPSESIKPEKKKIRTVAGMEVAPESLPQDVLAVARDLWQQGQRKEALGLLYRGSISWLITEELVEIQESDTEMDCVKRVAEGDAPEVVSYFKELTKLWMGAAYGSIYPEEEGMDQIWKAWPFRGRRSS